MTGLFHAVPQGAAPERVVVLGRGGFLGGAILGRARAAGLTVQGIGRSDIDLTADGAGERLADILNPTDSVVFVSAIAPTRTTDALIANLKMAEAVAYALVAKKVSHLVYISSDAVYAENVSLVSEETIPSPSSLHGMMHAAREMILRNAVNMIPIGILRPSLVYGVDDPHNGYGPNRFRRLAMSGQPIVLFGEGEERRDHVLVDDVAEITLQVVQRQSRGILNIATGASESFRIVAEMTAARVGTRNEIRPTPRSTSITHRHFDIAACVKAFPAFRYTSLTDGLTRVIDEAKAITNG